MTGLIVGIYTSWSKLVTHGRIRGLGLPGARLGPRADGAPTDGQSKWAYVGL